MLKKIFALGFLPCFMAFAEVGESNESGDFSTPQTFSPPQAEAAQSSAQKSSEVESSAKSSEKSSKPKSANKTSKKKSNKQKSSVHIFSSPLFSPPFAPITKDRQITSWSEMRDKNLTKQEYDYSCGAASLSSILEHYYGLENASEKEILDSVLLKKGIDINQKEEIQFDDEMKQKAHLSFYDMVGYAEDRGFRAFGLALDLPALYELKAPVIIYVKVRNIEHFSVLKGIDSRFVYLADPSFGNIKVSVAKFVEMFYPKKTREEVREEKQQAKLAKKSKKSHNEAESIMRQNHSQNRLMRGKIMAIVPNMQVAQKQSTQNENPQNQNDKDSSQANQPQSKLEINAEFMKLEKHSGFVYEAIKDMLLLRQ